MSDTEHDVCVGHFAIVAMIGDGGKHLQAFHIEEVFEPNVDYVFLGNTFKQQNHRSVHLKGCAVVPVDSIQAVLATKEEAVKFNAENPAPEPTWRWQRAWRPSRVATDAAERLKTAILAMENPSDFLLLAFKPLWPSFGKPILNESASWSAFALNPDNAALFYAWVYDKHPVAFDCTALLLGVEVLRGTEAARSRQGA